MTYASLRKTYGLPEWKVLNQYFDVGKLEESDNVLQFIVKQIMEKLDSYIKFFEDLLQPESLHSMYEVELLTEQDKAHINKVYKQLMLQYRTCFSSTVMNDFSEQAQLINQLSRNWQKTRKDLLSITEKVKASWNNQSTEKPSVGYFG